MVREVSVFVCPNLPAGCSMGSRMHMYGFGVNQGLTFVLVLPFKRSRFVDLP
jgi:hypothetical protein